MSLRINSPSTRKRFWEPIGGEIEGVGGCKSEKWWWRSPGNSREENYRLPVSVKAKVGTGESGEWKNEKRQNFTFVSPIRIRVKGGKTGLVRTLLDPNPMRIFPRWGVGKNVWPLQHMDFAFQIYLTFFFLSFLICFISIFEVELGLI